MDDGSRSAVVLHALSGGPLGRATEYWEKVASRHGFSGCQWLSISMATCWIENCGGAARD
jgi:hypothetical protein